MRKVASVEDVVLQHEEDVEEHGEETETELGGIAEDARPVVVVVRNQDHLQRELDNFPHLHHHHYHPHHLKIIYNQDFILIRRLLTNPHNFCGGFLLCVLFQELKATVAKTSGLHQASSISTSSALTPPPC